MGAPLRAGIEVATHLSSNVDKDMPQPPGWMPSMGTVLTALTMLVALVVWGIRLESLTIENQREHSQTEKEIAVINKHLEDIDLHGTRQIPTLQDRDNNMDQRLNELAKRLNDFQDTVRDVIVLRERQRIMQERVDQLQKSH